MSHANNMPECEKWPGHLRAICRGEHPTISIEDSNVHRATGMGGQFTSLLPIGCTQCEALADTKEKSLLALACGLVAAIVKWVACGRPVRTQEQIRERLEICKACPEFTGEKCNKCGCPCNDKTGGLANKLAMATEACPLDPPKWT